MRNYGLKVCGGLPRHFSSFPVCALFHRDTPANCGAGSFASPQKNILLLLVCGKLRLPRHFSSCLRKIPRNDGPLGAGWGKVLAASPPKPNLYTVCEARHCDPDEERNREKQSPFASFCEPSLRPRGTKREAISLPCEKPVIGREERPKQSLFTF